MADIKEYTDQIASAVYGEEVRGSIIGALNKVNDDNESYSALKEEVTQMHDAVEADYSSIQQIETNMQGMVTDVQTSAEEAAASSTASQGYSEQAAQTAETTKGYMDSAEEFKNQAKTYAEQAQAAANVEIATTEKAGIVKPDGNTITVDEDGTIHGNASVTVDTELSTESSNPISNSVVATKFGEVDDSISSLNTELVGVKGTYVSITLSANNWNDKTYSFETDYPSDTYNIEVCPDNTCTDEQYEAWCNAKMLGSATSNVITTLGDVPTVDIPVIVKVVIV
jgi:hypothetical protein